MAAGTPLTRVTLGAASVADDLGYVALDDMARALGGIAAEYRVIGGHMVTMLAARWQLGRIFTGRPETWISASRRSWPAGHVSSAGSRTLNYVQVAGNRFAREDYPISPPGW